MELYQQRTKGPRACSTCAKAKARCIPGPDASKCERCHRLDKQCPSQTPAPPRRRKEPRTTRVAELERKLEDLSSRILAQKQQQLPTPPESGDFSQAKEDGSVAQPPGLARSRHEPCPTGFQHIYPPALETFPASDMQAPLSSGPALQAVKQRTNPWNLTNILFGASMPDQITEGTTDPATASAPSVAGQTSLWPTGPDADALLDEYRSLARLHLFPFVVVPADLDSPNLRQQRPFLWKAVMMEACHHDGARQIVLGNQLFKDVTEAAYTRPHKNLDLLQGLQLLISSFHYNLNGFQMTNLLYLARSLCTSLGLNEGQGIMKQGELSSQCLEQMRALAGTYYLVTVIFTTNKKPDALMNTSYLDTCCRVLESRKEYATDELLVWLVRAQQLSQSISLTLAFRANATLKQTSNLPLSLIIKSLQQQLATFRDSVPPHMKSNPSLLCHQLVAEMLLYEIGLQENIALPVSDRLDYLWACVGAARAFFDNKFNKLLTSDSQPRFVCMCSFDFIYAFLTVLRLVTVSIPGWDLRVVREEVKLDYMVDKQIQDMECLADRRLRASSALAAAQGQALDDAQDPYRMVAEKLKVLRQALCCQLDGDFNDDLAKAVKAGAMTLTDAAQGIIEHLEGSLWQSLMSAAVNWDSFDTIHGFLF